MKSGYSVIIGDDGMTDAAVYRQGWTLDDVQWSAFDRSKAEPWMIAAIKAAALVEYNAPDYVTYLKRVFAGAGPGNDRGASSNGAARRASMAAPWAAGPKWPIPSFNLEEAFARFTPRLPAAAFRRFGRRFDSRQPPGRDDRPLRGRERHLVLLLAPFATPPTSLS